MIRATSPSPSKSTPEQAVAHRGMPEASGSVSHRASPLAQVAQRPNKAHTATANRIARRLNTRFNSGEGFDIQIDGLIVEVETTATMEAAMQRLQKQEGLVYIALTNKDGAAEALRRLPNNRVGIMDPHGNILRASHPRDSSC